MEAAMSPTRPRRQHGPMLTRIADDDLWRVETMPTYLVTVEKAPDCGEPVRSDGDVNHQCRGRDVAHDLASHWRRLFAPYSLQRYIAAGIGLR